MPQCSCCPVGGQGEKVKGTCQPAGKWWGKQEGGGTELEVTSLPLCKWHRAELHWMVEGTVHVYVHPRIYMSVFSVYIGNKFILKGSLSQGAGGS